jgi:hypothetical protein
MNLDSTKLLKGLTRRFSYGNRIDVTRDWITLLSLTLIAFAAIIAWNAWAFNTVAEGGVIGAPATSTPAVFSQTSLDAIHTVFSQRSDEELKYQTGVYGFADPSQ